MESLRTLVLAIVALLLSACGENPVAATTPMGAPATPMGSSSSVADLLIVAGQSNATGTEAVDALAGLPDLTIPFWVNSYYYDDGAHAWGPLDVSIHGGGVYSHEIATARHLQTAGLRVGVIKLTQGATFINRWVPTARAGQAGTKFYGELAEAVRAAPTVFPGATGFRVHVVWDQGEEEARYPDRVVVEKWSAWFGELRAGVEAAVAPWPVRWHVVRTCSTIRGKTFPGLLEAQQAAVVDADHLHNTDDGEFRADGVHRRGRWQSLLGETRIGPQIVRDVEQASPRPL